MAFAAIDDVITRGTGLQTISILGYSFYSFSYSLHFRGKWYQRYQMYRPCIRRSYCVSERVRPAFAQQRGAGIFAGEFHYIGKEASTRWAGDVDLFMRAEAGDLDPADETFREYERVVDPKYLDQIRTEAKQFSNKLLSRRSGVARSAIMNFEKGKNTIKPRTLRKLTKAVHNL